MAVTAAAAPPWAGAVDGLSWDVGLSVDAINVQLQMRHANEAAMSLSAHGLLGGALFSVVFDGALDGVLGQNRAVDLDGR